MNDFSNLPINFDEIPNANLVVFKPLERKYLLTQIISNTISWLVLFTILYSIYTFSKKTIPFINEYLIYILIGFIVLIVLTIILDIIGFPIKGFSIREKDVIYKSGLIFRKIIHIPFNRVQHCEVNQGILDRYLGLAKLKIYTAGGSKSDLTIPGMKNEDAMNLKSFILKKSDFNATSI